MPLIIGIVPICKGCDSTEAEAIEEAKGRPVFSSHILGPEEECMGRLCQNKGNLRKCAKCMRARYCSVECQKRDWKHHKTVCADLVPRDRGDGELQWDRNLRHWDERFRVCLQKAFYYGLDLKNDRSNLEKLGMMVVLKPRAHADPSARFTLQGVAVLPLSSILKIYASDPTAIVEKYNAQRERIKRERNGELDYGMQLLVVHEDAFRHFTDEPLPRMMMKFTVVYWAVVDNQPQGESKEHWLCDFRLQAILNAPRRLRHSDEVSADAQDE